MAELRDATTPLPEEAALAGGRGTPLLEEAALGGGRGAPLPEEAALGAGRGAPLPEGVAKVRMVEAMFDRIALRYDLLNSLLTLGLDTRWRRQTARLIELPFGSRVADLGCGTGDLCRELAGAGHRPVGIDRSRGMLAAARTVAPLIRADALVLPLPDASLDGVASGFALRNLASLPVFLSECARVLRPGGRLAFLELSEPEGWLLRVGHRFYFRRVVPLIGGLLSDRSAYRYLPRSTAYLPAPSRLVDAVCEAGFPDAERLTVSAGIAQIVVGTRA